jgi:hypothetical protein
MEAQSQQYCFRLKIPSLEQTKYSRALKKNNNGFRVNETYKNIHRRIDKLSAGKEGK